MNEETFELKEEKLAKTAQTFQKENIEEIEENQDIDKEDNLSLENKIKKSDRLNLAFDYIKLNIASPDQIKKWAQRHLPKGSFFGEVKNPDTLNYRDLEPEIEGLFCQRIFGPVNDWKCACRKYKGLLVDQICELCHVELTESRVRRYRMGYINLVYSCAHIWYFKGTPNYLHLILKLLESSVEKTRLDKKHIEEIIYFQYMGPSIPQDNPLWMYSLIEQKDILPTDLFEELLKPRKYDLSGTEILVEALNRLDADLPYEIERIRTIPLRCSSEDGISLLKDRHVKCIRILENFIATNSKLTSIIWSTLPILPPTLRPLVEIEDSKLVNADVNEFYRLILMRNTRLAQFDVNLRSLPDSIMYEAKKLLQGVVDNLIDNARLPQSKILCLNDRPLKSLTEALEGKEGRFRQHLFGKRVDYSARSVIVVGPNLRLNQCGLPYDISAKLFEGHLINALFNTLIKAPSNNAKFARLLIKRRKLFIWKLLEKLLEENSILLNRAPTLHRFGIQAFNPILILGRAIQLHPLVCTGFNADFDGDQMAVHLPLYKTSQLESKELMRPSSNILSPANGDPILKPTQDMVIGSYYLTLMVRDLDENVNKYFSCEEEALNAFYSKSLHLHDIIFVRYNLENSLAVENNQIQLFQDLKSLSHEKISYFKILSSKKNKQKLYLLTNLGIITAYLISKDQYILQDLYVQTTVGRVVFTDNLRKVFKQLDVFTI